MPPLLIYYETMIYHLGLSGSKRPV